MNTQLETPCPLCNGTGWQVRQRENEREVVRCQCRVRQNRSERLLATAHIPERYQRQRDWRNFKYDPAEMGEKSVGEEPRSLTQAVSLRNTRHRRPGCCWSARSESARPTFRSASLRR